MLYNNMVKQQIIEKMRKSGYDVNDVRLERREDKKMAVIITTKVGTIRSLPRSNEVAVAKRIKKQFEIPLLIFEGVRY